ncbi:hypothetical protein Q5424_00880 [Conexibacter sp. JD483]|uniref:hypothetical protein n=1 Tax=unclassified Conexibacter TaxID=2627773 RepID=UPI0027268B74|nr:MULTISPECIES: hypothetical protein [unclassified Conexibacter]MDO8189034.1 hypothetical protein [Conexibacter sp. CPCC 205706]MDO8198525.1 hypothetical protein [Conexibacter sp. CPCC 205762]MDR9367611.1 hypothetical protein [Conexibacter sp. JD483]
MISTQPGRGLYPSGRRVRVIVSAGKPTIRARARRSGRARAAGVAPHELAVAVGIDPSGCYPPNGRIPIYIRGAAPRTTISAVARDSETSVARGRANTRGNARLTMIAPAAVPAHAATAVQRIEVTATSTSSTQVAETVAYLLGQPRVCAYLRGGSAAGRRPPAASGRHAPKRR